MSHASAIHEPTRTKLSDPPLTTHHRSNPDNVPVRSKTVHVNPNSGHRAGPSVQSQATESSRTHKEHPATTSSGEGRSRNPSASGASGLTRKPTLIAVDQLSRFRQGTLLGDLKQGTTHRPTQATLPSHITPHMPNSNPSDVAPVIRGWEQMGPAERREHLAEVQARAKLDGKTFLTFQDKDPFGAALAVKKLTASPPAFLSSVPNLGIGGEESMNSKPNGLSRSRTLGNQSRRS